MDEDIAPEDVPKYARMYQEESQRVIAMKPNTT